MKARRCIGAVCLLCCVLMAVAGAVLAAEPVRYGYTAKRRVNVREQADPNGALVVQLRDADTRCVITETVEGVDGRPWHRIQLAQEIGMLEGYVRADFLNEAESAQGTAPPLRLPYNASVGPRELAAHTAAPIATKSPAAPPAKAETAKVWIPTGGGTKYHARADCSGMRAPRLVTLEEAIVEGYQDACKKCF